MNKPPRILRLSDAYTGHAAVIRLAQEDEDSSVGQLLDKYLLNPGVTRLINNEAITPESLDSLRALQDLCYACDDHGRLTSMYPGAVWRGDGRPAALNDRPTETESRWHDAQVTVIELTLDRTNVGYDRNWKGFHRRRWDNNPSLYRNFVTTALEKRLGENRASQVLSLDSHDDRLVFLETLAKRVWESEFENYSRFIGQKLIFKTGDETVRSFSHGSGGICTEKVQALKFLTDHYGLESEYLIGGDGAADPAPETRLREMLKTFDFRFGRRYMRYWQHTALLYHIDGVPVVVDATNGNIPFLFLKGADAERLLGYEDKPSVPVRMVETTEEYYYHRVQQDIPQDLFFALEGWMVDTDMVQVFENELGLFLSNEYYVTPLPYRNDKEYERLSNEYLEIARRAGFPSQVKKTWDFESEIGQAFVASHESTAAKILDARDHLILRYNEWDLPGHEAGLVVYRLS